MTRTLAALLCLAPALALADAPVFDNGYVQLYTAQPPADFENVDQGGRPAPGQRVLKDWRSVPDMVIGIGCEFELCIVRASGQVSFQISKYGSDDCRHEDWFLLASRITVDGVEVPGSISNGNAARREHYQTHSFHIVLAVEEGSHRVAVETQQHPKTPGDCRVYIKEPQYSRLQVEVSS